jgi:hypothetical protein
MMVAMKSEACLAIQDYSVSCFQLRLHFNYSMSRVTIASAKAAYMERRNSERKKVTARVYLYVTGQPFRRCIACNLSSGGVFVETRPLSLRRGRKVQLVFALTLDGVIRLRRLPAVVARTSKNGIGMLLQSQLPPRRRDAPSQSTSL